MTIHMVQSSILSSTSILLLPLLSTLSSLPLSSDYSLPKPLMSSSALWRDTTPSLSMLLTSATAVFVIFSLVKYIYRVTFHPLAAFPGPRLAALTSLYSASYDLHPKRSYCKAFAALHDRYGLTIVLRSSHGC